MSLAPPPGVYVPAVLFFTATDELDIPSIKSHIIRLARAGVTGILVQGSNGEAQHLSHSERTLAIRTTRQTLDENGFEHVVIIAGTGAQSTKETQLLNVQAKEAGAAFALVLTPSTWLPAMNKDAIIRFHREVADASPIPTMIYNFPTVTAGIDLDSDVLFLLGAHPNIVGTKLSCGSIAKAHRLTLTHSPEFFAVFLGRSDAHLPGLFVGSQGTIAALPNLAPKAHVHAYKLWKEGKVAEAIKLQEVFSRADWEMGKLGGVAGLKLAVSTSFGYGSGAVRGPLTAANPERLQGAESEWIRKLVGIEKAL